MKRLLLSLLLVTGFYLHTLCQDILVFKNGDEVKVKISEVMPDMVKYKKWDNQDGPIYSELKGNIFMIKYQNGSKDVFANQGMANSNKAPVSNEETMKNEAVKILENSIVNDLKRRQKDQVVKVSSIIKTNGIMKNPGGQSIYTVYFDMTLEFIADGWLIGNMFEGYWQHLNVYASQPNLAASGQQNLYTTKKYPRGTVVILGCQADMLKTDNGYKASNLDIKAEKSISQGISNNNNGSPNQANSNNNVVSDSRIAKIIKGDWSGDVYQKGVKKPYSLQLSCNVEKNEFKVNYPAFGCSGVWSIEKASDTSIDFREHILAGKSGCVDGGLIKLNIVNNSKLECNFYMSGSKTASAKGELVSKEKVGNAVSSDGAPALKAKDTTNLKKMPIKETVKKDTLVSDPDDVNYSGDLEGTGPIVLKVINSKPTTANNKTKQAKTTGNVKTLILISPTYVLGDLPHLMFKDPATHKEQEYECDWTLPAIKEIVEKCEDHEGCPALKGQAYSVTLEFKLMDITNYDTSSGESKPSGKKEMRWVIIAAKKNK